ncbi:MAG: hypothetical protein U0325_20075 [Polyangiales bacterium]
MSYLNHQPMLVGWSAVAVLALLLLAVPRAQAWALRGAAAALFSVWALDVYMIDVTPHWSQRPLFRALLRRAPPSTADPRFPFDPIIAHQMNWKGENFYTGNHVVAEECGLKYCTGSTAEFLRSYAGARVFVITEHSRVRGLISTKSRDKADRPGEITTEGMNNKFVLVEADLAPVGARRR